MADEGGGFNHARLRERMAELGKTPVDVAAALRVSERTARKWRDGVTAPRFAMAMRLAHVLGLDPAELLLTPAKERARGS